MIEGKLVRLRAVQEGDVEPYWRFLNRQEDWARVDVFAPVPREIAAERLRMARLSFDDTRVLDLAIETVVEGRPVGMVNVGPVHATFRRAECGIEIWDPADRGKGYAREALALLLALAFDWLNLHRVEATINASNEASLRLFEKAGFKREGALNDRVFHAGKYEDEVWLGLLEQDWRASRGR